MLTVDFARLPSAPVTACSTWAAAAAGTPSRSTGRGADVVALDRSAADLVEVEAHVRGDAGRGRGAGRRAARPCAATRTRCPSRTSSFDAVIAAEILEHLPDDERAMAELFRVLRPGGQLAVTVPRWGPERVCWALSDAYHQVEGGHVRIYRGRRARRAAGRAPGWSWQGTGHTHGLHAPYWWLKCAVGVDNAEHPLVRAYHRLLVWDMMTPPWLTRALERALDPVIGKSLVVYLRKPERARAAAA